jgi:hypothetical protein|tara:strand:+ start:905 stop:1231 length:327 start_codon:yes stop_codon:yes gene_type:complete
MAMQPQQMNMQPQQMDMQPTDNPLASLDPEQREAMMTPSDSIRLVLLARLGNLSPEELQMLDSAITPEVAQVLSRFLPELQQIVDMISGQGGQQAMPEGGQMGALNGM